MKYSYAFAILAGALTAIGCAANEADLVGSSAELNSGCVDADDEKPVDNAKDEAADTKGAAKDQKAAAAGGSSSSSGASAKEKAPVDGKDKPSNGAKPKPCQNKPSSDGKPSSDAGTDVKVPADKPSPTPKPTPEGKDVDSDGDSDGKNIAIHCSNGLCQCASGPNKGKSCEATKPGPSNCEALCAY